MESDSMELEIDFGKYLDILRRRFWLVVLGAVIAGGLALVVSLFLPPIYEAEADIASVKSFSQISLSPEYKTLSEAQLAQGLDVAARQKALIAIARGGELASSVISRLGNVLTSDEREPSKLLQSVTVSADGDLIRIKVQNQDAQNAVKIANTWAQLYADRVNQLYTENPTTVDQIQRQTDQALQAYQATEVTLSQFIGQNQINVLNAEITSKQNTTADLYATLRSLQRLLQDARSLQDLVSKDSTLSTNDVNSRLALLLVRANAATLSYSAPSTGGAGTQSSNNAPFSQGNPIAVPSAQVQPFQIQLGSSTDAPQSNLRQQLDLLITTLEGRERLLESQIADPSLQQQVMSLQKDLEQQNAKKQELTSARDLAWSTYKTLASKMQEVQLAQQSSGTIVRVAGSATAPGQPVAPKKTMNTLIAALVGLVISVFLVFTVEFLAPRVYSAHELARSLETAVFELQASDLPTLNSEKVRYTRAVVPTAIYQIWTNLFLRSQSPGSTLLVADMGNGEKGTSLVSGLGLVSAQSAKSVVLVETDAYNPLLCRFWGLPNTRGWTDLIDGKDANVDTYLQPTHLSNLVVLGSGPVGSSVTQSMVSPRLSTLVGALRKKADTVLFGTSTVASMTDALLLGKQVDEIILVIHAGETRADVLAQFKNQLETVGAKIGCAVLVQPSRRWSVFPNLAARVSYRGENQSIHHSLGT